MDIYGLCDLIAIMVGVVVAYHLRNKESYLLLAFFSLSSAASFLLFQTDYYLWFPLVFIALSVVFGLSSNRHPVALGYVGYLILIGLNSIQAVVFYSFYVYLLFAYQLWVVGYEPRNSRIGRVWVSCFNQAHN